MGLLEAAFGTVTGDILGGKAAEASERASGIAAGTQREALEYLKEKEALPERFRSEALTGLAGLYGLGGGEGDQQAMIDRAMQSPLYKSLIGGRGAGEEAILRSASATGGLRSGDVQGAMYDYNTQLENQAVLQAYQQQVQGMQALSGLPSGATNIANLMTGIGETQAQGIIGAAGARQQGMQNLIGLGGAAATAFSDRRLKKNIELVGKVNGWPWYVWDWNMEANNLGLSGSSCGVLADEVRTKMPEAVTMRDGFMMVDYNAIGIFEEN